MIGTSQGAQTLYSTLTFRLLLDALARPGKINQLEYPHFWGEAPCFFSHTTQRDTPLNLFALGAFLILLDRETTFAMGANGQWLARSDAAVRWTMLRSGSKVADADRASFAFFCDEGSGELLTQLHAGTLLEPELSATAFLCVQRLSSTALDEGVTLALCGPGIQKACSVHVAGLATSTIDAMRSTRRSYPVGIDVYLIDAAGRCVGLPRTTRIEAR